MNCPKCNSPLERMGIKSPKLTQIMEGGMKFPKEVMCEITEQFDCTNGACSTIVEVTELKMYVLEEESK